MVAENRIKWCVILTNPRLFTSMGLGSPNFRVLYCSRRRPHSYYAYDEVLKACPRQPLGFQAALPAVVPQAFKYHCANTFAQYILQ